MVSVYKRKSLFCCPLQQHPLGVLGHISNRKLLLLEVLFPGYQLVTALQLVSDWDNSRAVPEGPLLPGEVGVSPECWQWVCVGQQGIPSLLSLCAAGTHVVQLGSFSHMGTLPECSIVSSQNVLTLHGLEGTRMIPQWCQMSSSPVSTWLPIACYILNMYLKLYRYF